jgi:hypothetical protein
MGKMKYIKNVLLMFDIILCQTIGLRNFFFLIFPDAVLGNLSTIAMVFGIL